MAAQRICTAVFLVATALYSPSASAGVYTDELSKCLVRSSTTDDQIALVRWMFSAMAMHPAVTPLASINAEQRQMLDKQAAEMMQRLILQDCRKESVEAMKYEGGGAMEAGFNVLGQVAARGLMSHPQVSQQLQGLENFVDKEKFLELGREAGLPPPAGR